MAVQKIVDLAERVRDYPPKQQDTADEVSTNVVHRGLTTNPHATTAAQTGADTSAQVTAKANTARDEAKAYTDVEVDKAVKAGAVKPRGNWDASTAYAENDLVFHTPTGDSWYAKEPTVVGEEPNVSAKWNRYAEGLNKATADAIYVRSYMIDAALGGTDATAHINARITEASDFAALSGGKMRVVIGPSTTGAAYDFTEIVVKPNVTLESIGGRLRYASGTAIDPAATYYLIHNLDGLGGGHPNVTLRNLNIDGNAANNGSFLVADAITIVGENAIVDGCTIKNTPDSGITLSRATNAQVTNNRLIGGSDLGIYINDGTGDNLHECVVTGNRITGFPQGGIAAKRVSQFTVIAHNTIYECGNGITMENASTATDFSLNNIISNNIIRRIGHGAGDSSAATGIILRGSHHTVCQGNRISDPRRFGITIAGTDHASVMGNTVSFSIDAAADSVGIQVLDRENVGTTKCVIDGNTVDGSLSSGIHFTATGTGINTHNVVTANVVTTAGGTAMNLSVACQSNTFTENVLDGSTFDLTTVSGAVGNIWGNNRLVNATTSGIMGKVNESIVTIQDLKVTTGDAAPTTGTWAIGDRCYNNTSPGQAGTGWVCVTAGTPGTWRPFGYAPITHSVVWDPPSMAIGESTGTQFALTGANPTDIIWATFTGFASGQNVQISAFSFATSTVRVVITNQTGATLDLPSGTLKVAVIRTPA